MLAISFEGDELAPASFINYLSGKARHSVRTRRHYTCTSAGAAKLGHFSWVHSSDELARWITDWIGGGNRSAGGVAGFRHTEAERGA